jgi:hypothetical protein
VQPATQALHAEGIASTAQVGTPVLRHEKEGPHITVQGGMASETDTAFGGRALVDSALGEDSVTNVGVHDKVGISDSVGPVPRNTGAHDTVDISDSVVAPATLDGGGELHAVATVHPPSVEQG